jgi:hypothetical protein
MMCRYMLLHEFDRLRFPNNDGQTFTLTHDGQLSSLFVYLMKVISPFTIGLAF